MTDGAEVATYAWDAADRLTGVILPDGSSANFGYDADGRRVQQTNTINGLSSTVEFLAKINLSPARAAWVVALEILT